MLEKILLYLNYLYRRGYSTAKFVTHELTHNGQVTNIAASLTYTTLLSLVPLFTVMATILSAFPAVTGKAGSLQDYIFSLVIPTSRDVIQQTLDGFAKQTQGLSATGAIFLVVTSLLLIIRIEKSFNIIWHVPKKRNLLYAIVMYWGILTLGPLLMAFGFASTTSLTALEIFQTTTQRFSESYTFFLKSVPFFLNWIAFSLLYTIVPNTTVSPRHSIIGGFIGSFLFESAKAGFVYYVTNFFKYQVIYGALATFPLFLMWIYISWIIVLIGAEITYALSLPFLQDDEGRPNHFMQAYNVLGFLWRAQVDGKTLTSSDVQELSYSYRGINFMGTIDELLKKDLIEVTSENNFILSRDVANFRLIELYDMMDWKFPNPKLINSEDTQAWNTNLHHRSVIIRKAIEDQLDISLLELFEKEKDTEQYYGE